jgi:serine phosphatase RsbU (regulator of sigma subunit)
MLWLRKKLFRKFLIIELALISVGLAVWLLTPWGWAGIVVIALGSLISFWLLVSHPMQKILGEVKALLTGKHYNRIYTKKMDEVGVVAHFFNEATRSIERVTTDIKEHRRIASELNVAQKIQRDLLPQSNPQIPGLDVIAKTKSAAEIGGDSFDFITKGEQTFLYIGDVTGHGIPAGLVMMIVDTLIHTFSDLVTDSHQLVVQVNKYLKPRIQSTMFMTMVMLRWDHLQKQLYYTGAGHETIVHYSQSEKTLNNIKAGGIALGMVPDNTKLTKEEALSLENGDFLVLYSDGIVEARTSSGEMVGMERFLKWIEKFAAKAENAEDLFQNLALEVSKFLGEHIQLDDMTLIVIKKIDETTTTEQAPKNQESTQWENENAQGMIDYDTEKVEESGLSES